MRTVMIGGDFGASSDMAESMHEKKSPKEPKSPRSPRKIIESMDVLG
jgi:hypothetical protein